MTLPKTPSGCTHCGVEERSHPWLWTQKVGIHQYVPPTDEQIKQQMRQRRQQKEQNR